MNPKKIAKRVAQAHLQKQTSEKAAKTARRAAQMTRLRLPTKDDSQATFTLPKTPGVYAHVWFDKGVAYSDFGSRVPDSGEWQVIISTSEDPLNLRPRGRELGREIFRFPEKKAEAAVHRMAVEYIGRQLTQQARRLKRAAVDHTPSKASKAIERALRLTNTDRKAVNAVWVVLWMGIENNLAKNLTNPLKSGKIEVFRDTRHEPEEMLADEWDEEVEISGGGGYTTETMTSYRAKLSYGRHYEFEIHARMSDIKKEAERISKRGLTTRLLPNVTPEQIAALYDLSDVRNALRDSFKKYLKKMWDAQAERVKKESWVAISRELVELHPRDGIEEFRHLIECDFNNRVFFTNGVIEYEWHRDGEEVKDNPHTYLDRD